jgi:hypothetical protein
MRTQGALPEFMRKIPLTTQPPIRGRRLGVVKILILEFWPTYGAFIFMGDG